MTIKNLQDFYKGEKMKNNLDAAINAEYRAWLKDTIQADVKYCLDPAVGVVVEDLNAYTGLNLGWEEWNRYYIENADYIKELESAL